VPARRSAFRHAGVKGQRSNVKDKNDMLNLNHKKLDVWNVGIQFIKEIYNLTESFPAREIYGLSNQLRRASVSITSNIAEGSSRKSSAERKRFYEVARSSLVEIDTQIEIAFELNFIKESDKQQISDLINKLFAMITNLIKKT
jgi:four helix bundle protein